MGYNFNDYYTTHITTLKKRYHTRIAFSALHWDLNS